MSSRTCTLPMPFGDVPVTVNESGAGAAVLLLHGGAGPDSFAAFGDALAARAGVRVLTPFHPGFGGTPRPNGVDSVRKLTEVYARLLAELDLTGVTVAGNPIGGWIAAELALAAPDRVERQLVIDGAGLVRVPVRGIQAGRRRACGSGHNDRPPGVCARWQLTLG